MILEDQLALLPPDMRRIMQKRIESSILQMVSALRGRSDSDSLHLTLVKEVANIKAAIDLAQSLHQPQTSLIEQDPDDL